MKKFLIILLSLTVAASVMPVSASDSVSVMAVDRPYITTATYIDGVEVSLTCATEGAEIYYTLDGTTPQNVEPATAESVTKGRRKYNGEFMLNTAGTYKIRAQALKDGQWSDVAIKNDPVKLSWATDISSETPTNELIRVASSQDGRYMVEFLDVLDNYTVFFTLGTTTRPSRNSREIHDTSIGNVYITKPTYISLLICREGYAPRLISVLATQEAWKGRPTVANVGVAYESFYGGKNIILRTDTEGAAIYYRLSPESFNDEVTTADARYTSPVSVTAAGTYYIKAFAAKDGSFDSEQTSLMKIVVEKCAAPIVTVEPNEKNRNYVNVTAESPDGSEIYYTTNGTDPSQSSIKYTGTTVFAENYNLKFIAVKSGNVSSDIVEKSVSASAKAPTAGAQTSENGSKTISLSAGYAGAEIYYHLTDQISEPYNANNPYLPTKGTDTLYEGPFTVDESGTYYLWAREYVDGGYGPLLRVTLIVNIVDLGLRIGSLANGVKTATVYPSGKKNVYYALTKSIIPPEEVPITPENLYTYPITVEDTCYVTAVEIDGSGVILNSVQSKVEVVNGPRYPETVGMISMRSEAAGDKAEISLDCATEGADLFYSFDQNPDASATTGASRCAGTLTLERDGYLHVLAAKPGFLQRAETYRICVGEKTAAPEITSSFANGRYTVAVTSSTPGARYYYTLDGTMPRVGVGEAPGGMILAPGDNVTLNVIARADGYAPSELVTEVLSQGEPEECGDIMYDVGDIIGGVEIGFSVRRTEGASVYYTTDGSEPNIDSLLYDENNKPTVTTEEETVIKAVAVKNGCKNSDVLVCDPIELSKLTTPRVSQGQLGGEAQIQITNVPNGAEAYYTTDGTIPCPNAPGTNSGKLFYIDETSVITVLFAQPGMVNSNLFQNTITVDDTITAIPKMDGEPVPVMGGKTLSLVSKTDGAEIYYTMTDAPVSEVTPSTLYTGPIFLQNASNRIIANARKSGMKDSVKTTIGVTIDRAPTPKASIEPNSEVNSGDEVRLSVDRSSDDSSEYTIFYTTDGSVPNLDSPQYDGPIAITENTHIRAAAAAVGKVMSGVLELYYSVDGGPLTIDASGLERSNNQVFGSVKVDVSGVDAAGKKVMAAVYCGETLCQAVSSVASEGDGVIELDGFDILLGDRDAVNGLVVKVFVFENDGSLAPVCENAVSVM